MKLRTLCTSLVLASVLSAPAFAEYSKSDIEKIVHDYIVNNPDVLIEASDNVKRRQMEIQKQKQDKMIAEIISNKQFPQSGPAKAKHTVIEFFTTLFMVSGEYLPDIFKIDSDSKLLMRSIVAEIVGFCHGYITIDLVTALDRESSSTADTVRLLVPDSDGGFSVVETSEELE